MKKFSELNNFAKNRLAFTDNRTPRVVLRYNSAPNLSERLTQASFPFKTTIEVQDIIKVDQCLPALSIEFNMTGATINFTLPTGVFVSNTPQGYLIQGFTTAAQWNTIVDNAIVNAPADFQGSLVYTVELYWFEPIRKSISHTTGTVIPLGELSVTTTLTSSAKVIHGGKSNIISVFGLRALDYIDGEADLTATFSLDGTTRIFEGLTSFMDVFANTSLTATKIMSLQSNVLSNFNIIPKATPIYSEAYLTNIQEPQFFDTLTLKDISSASPRLTGITNNAALEHTLEVFANDISFIDTLSTDGYQNFISQSLPAFSGTFVKFYKNNTEFLTIANGTGNTSIIIRTYNSITHALIRQFTFTLATDTMGSNFAAVSITEAGEEIVVLDVRSNKTKMTLSIVTKLGVLIGSAQQNFIAGPINDFVASVDISNGTFGSRVVYTAGYWTTGMANSIQSVGISTWSSNGTIQTLSGGIGVPTGYYDWGKRPAGSTNNAVALAADDSKHLITGRKTSDNRYATRVVTKNPTITGYYYQSTTEDFKVEDATFDNNITRIGWSNKFYNAYNGTLLKTFVNPIKSISSDVTYIVDSLGFVYDFINLNLIDDNSANLRTKVDVIGSENSKVSTTVTKFGGNSLRLDSVSSLPWVTPNTVTATRTAGWKLSEITNWTVEGWMYRETFNFDIHDYFSSDWVIGFYENKLFFRPTLEAADVITSSTNFPRDQWVHFAITRNGPFMRIFQNGIKVAEITNFTSVTNPIQPLIIGSGNYYLDEFRISSDTRYNSNFTPPANPFVDDTNTLLLLHMNVSNYAGEINEWVPFKQAFMTLPDNRYTAVVSDAEIITNNAYCNFTLTQTVNDKFIFNPLTKKATIVANKSRLNQMMNSLKLIPATSRTNHVLNYKLSAITPSIVYTRRAEYEYVEEKCNLAMSSQMTITATVL